MCITERIVGWGAMIVLIAVSLAAHAQVPPQISYQGRLTEASGAPVADGSYQINFKIYGSEFGDDSLWWSDFQSVEVQDGLFEYKLGAASPFPEGLFNPGVERFLGITVDVNPEGIPRLPFSSVAFAFSANYAEFSGMTEHAFHADTAEYARVSPGGLALPYIGELNSTDPAFHIGNGGANSGVAIQGLSEENDGVVGWTGSPDKSGVYGYSYVGHGVSGRSEGDGSGVFGETNSSDTSVAGVRGFNFGGGPAIKGTAGAGGAGIVGSNVDDGLAGLFLGDLQIINGHGKVIADTLTPSDTVAFQIEYTGPALGTGISPAGVMSICRDDSDLGVGGYMVGGEAGVVGEVIEPGPVVTATGVYGNVTRTGGLPDAGDFTGVFGWVLSDGGSYNTGVAGYAAAGETNVGIVGSATDYAGDAAWNVGVHASAVSDAPSVVVQNNYGVESYCYDGDTSYGLYTYSRGLVKSYGVFCEACNAPENYGIFAKSSIGAFDWAGYFDGDVGISGTLYGGKAGIRIDHPVDPENKYLQHSYVVSPDMMTVYNGNVITDTEGYATVTLPDYFEPLNSDFRYQLTVIGDFAQAIVAEKIRDNQFVVRTDRPEVEVSWQVTGVRQDASARADRIPVEVEKREIVRGFYLDPTAFGFTEERAVNYRLHGSSDARSERAQERVHQASLPKEMRRR